MNSGVTFAPTPDGSRWQVLAERATTTLYRVAVDDAGLDIGHDPHDLSALDEAVSARALDLIAQGRATIIGTEQDSTSITSWELEGSGRAQEALEHHMQRGTGRAQR